MRLDTAIETALYRVTQEAFTNISRHAAAKRVGMILKLSEAEALVIIEDDGCGMSLQKAHAAHRLGLTGMRERLALVGGTLEIESEFGQGTTVFARVPHASGNLVENIG
jgi:signal transduction histidine kinase